MKKDLTKKTIKPSVSMYYNKRERKYKITWFDPEAWCQKNETVEGDEHASERLVEIRAEIEDKLLDGHYDTNERRLRKFIEVRDRLKYEKSAGAKFPGQTIVDIAIRESRIGGGYQTKGEKVIKAIDLMVANGDMSGARDLRAKLNRSIITAYNGMDEKYKYNKSKIDGAISHNIGTIARKFDERCNNKGGADYRDECMSLLKQLSAKFDEWRASE